MRVKKGLDFQSKVAANRGKKKKGERSWGRLNSMKINVSRSITF